MISQFGPVANRDEPAVGQVGKLLAPFAPLAKSVVAVPVPTHEHHEPEVLVETALGLGIPRAAAAADVPSALRVIASYDENAPVVMVMGSLYLAGKVLEANDEIPD